MKKKSLAIIILLIAPIVICVLVIGFYYRYEKLAETYDCYPIKKCQFDIDGDSVNDSVKLEKHKEKDTSYIYRLKVFLKKESEEVEVLNIKYQSTDYTYRTHFGFFIEDDVRKFVIYDTINESQFFYWNGQELIASQIPSNFERKVRKSFYYNDDTGGFHTKGIIIFGILFLSIIFYVIFASILAYSFYIKKRLVNLQ